MLNEILEYEKRLLEDREQLMKLVENSGKDGSDITRDKLNFFKAELVYMNKQLEILNRESLAKEAAQVKKTSVQPPMHSNVQMQGVPQQQWQRPQQPMMHPQQQWQRPQQPMMHPQQQWQRPQQSVMQQSQATPPQAIPPQDLEKTFGKTVMGIVASGLIFISIILFATLLIPSLNNTIKMIITYVVSIAICGVGWFKLHKNREDKFYLALTGCGMGAIYISLFLSNLYFKAIGDITLYVLIAVWAIGICLLSRYNNIVFQIIGQIGVVISMIFGVMLCAITSDESKFVVLIIFYIITSIVLYMAHFKKRFNNNLCAHISNVVNLLIILLGSLMIVEEGHYTSIIVLAYIAAHIVVSYLCTWKENEMAQGLMVSLYVLLFVFNMLFLIEDGELCAVLVFAFAMIMNLASEFRKKGRDDSRIMVQVLTIIVGGIALLCNDFTAAHGFVPFLIAPFLALGFWRNRNSYKVGALVFTYLYIFIDNEINVAEWFILGFLVIAAMYTLIYIFRKQYNGIYKGFVHVVAVFFLVLVGSELISELTDSGELTETIVFIVVSLFNVAIMKSCYSKNLLTDVKEKGTLFTVINGFMMFVGLCSMHSELHIVLHILVVLVTLGIFMVNSKTLLDKHPSGFGGGYVGFKFMVFMLVLLSAYDATDYVVSVSCFLFAVVSIAVGFGFKYKSLRVYGLVLSIISVFKLIVMDIEYANTLGYAISFFVAGVICFAISLLYNFVDKRMKKAEERIMQNMNNNSGYNM